MKGNIEYGHIGENSKMISIKMLKSDVAKFDDIARKKNRSRHYIMKEALLTYLSYMGDD